MCLNYPDWHCYRASSGGVTFFFERLHDQKSGYDRGGGHKADNPDCIELAAGLGNLIGIGRADDRRL